MPTVLQLKFLLPWSVKLTTWRDCHTLNPHIGYLLCARHCIQYQKRWQENKMRFSPKTLTQGFSSVVEKRRYFERSFDKLNGCSAWFVVCWDRVSLCIPGDLKLSIALPCPPEFWSFRHAPSYLTKGMFGDWLIVDWDWVSQYSPGRPKLTV